ncbi:desulfoferrodoxin [Candidatus Latescibacterota bacterium]
MAVAMGIYKCIECGNIVEVLHSGGGDLVCCGEKMVLLVDNTVDAAKEKHIPVVEKTADGYKVSVGSIAHPMQDDHYIEWISICADGKTYRKFLNPGDAPEAEFCIEAAEISAHSLCNLHGMWKA